MFTFNVAAATTVAIVSWWQADLTNRQLTAYPLWTIFTCRFCPGFSSSSCASALATPVAPFIQTLLHSTDDDSELRAHDTPTFEAHSSPSHPPTTLDDRPHTPRPTIETVVPTWRPADTRTGASLPCPRGADPLIDPPGSGLGPPGAQRRDPDVVAQGSRQGGQAGELPTTAPSQETG